MSHCIFLAIHEKSNSSVCLASVYRFMQRAIFLWVCTSFTAAGSLWTGPLFEERVKKIARRGRGRNREPVHKLCRRISSVDKAVDCIVGGGGFDSRGQTDTQALEVIDLYNIARVLALCKSYWAAMNKIFIYERPCVNKMTWAFFFLSGCKVQLSSFKLQCSFPSL